MTKVTKVTIYQDTAGEWRHRAFARNGRVVGTSEEGFKLKNYVKLRVHDQYPTAVITVEEPTATA